MRSRLLYLLAIIVLLAALSASVSERPRGRPRKQRPVQQVSKHERHHKSEHCHKRKHRHHHRRPKAGTADKIPTAANDATKKPTDPKPPVANPADPIPTEANPAAADTEPSSVQIEPQSRNIAIQGEIFVLAKFSTCPPNRELKCRDSWCSHLTCDDAGLYSVRICPRLPRTCNALYCSCANSQGYFRESKGNSRCVHKSQCQNGERFLWTKLNNSNINQITPSDDNWFKIGVNTKGLQIYMIRAIHERSLLPGIYAIPLKGYLVSESKTHVKVDNSMEVLCDPNNALEWVPYNSSIIPACAVKAGVSEDGKPQYIGKKDILDLKDKASYTVAGRVELGVLWHTSASGNVFSEKQFDILCDRHLHKLG